MTQNIPNLQFTSSNYEKVFATLLSFDDVVKINFAAYLKEEYSNSDIERLYYIDISVISREIISKLKKREIECFEHFFEKIEEILNCCDNEIESLIVIGLFESIQNNCGKEINYYKDFDKWMKPNSKLKWYNLIDFWEGTKWRNSRKAITTNDFSLLC